MKPPFIVCTPRRAFTISFTGICFLSPVSKFIIHHSIFVIRYSLFSIHFAVRISCQTGVYRMHAAACVYDFVYRDLVLITRLQIQSFIIRYSLFDIRYFPSISPFAFRVKPAFIVCTPRRAFTISFTGIWLLSPVCDFVIKIPHSSVSSGKGSRP